MNSLVHRVSLMDQREDLAARIQDFPKQLRIEQTKNFCKYYLIVLVVCLLLYFLTWSVLSVVRSLFGLFHVSTSWFDYLFYASAWAANIWFLRTTFARETLRKIVGLRSPPFRRLDPTPIMNALREERVIGLHLRAFGDEHQLYPQSRDFVPATLAKFKEICFISISNMNNDHFDSKFNTLEIPDKTWKQTVVDLMNIAGVIVIDTNGGIIHWMSELNVIEVVNHFGALSAEFGRSAGFIEEIQEIIARGLSHKLVAVVPPGWPELSSSGKIKNQIFDEQIAAVYASKKYPLLASEKEFTRTTIKRLLFKIPRTVVSDEQIRQAVEGVMSTTSAL
jgi:hypothetical protein